MESKIERLPFTIRVAGSDLDLERAVSIRQSAYARHLPELAARLGEPEAGDCDGSSVVLLAESKLDGSPIGTMRIQTNRLRPLALEQSVVLPERFGGQLLVEATRLGIVGGAIGRVVKTMLFKALYLYCCDNDVDRIVIAARSPLDQMYEGLLFRDVFPDAGFVPMAHAGNLPHRVLEFDVPGADRLWSSTRHPLYETIARTRHPDIDVADRRFHVAEPPFEGMPYLRAAS